MAIQLAPALINAADKGNASICAAFGGQGPRNPHCLQDLAQLYKQHPTALKELFDVAISTFNQFMSLPRQSGFHETHQLDLQRWLTDPSSAPSPDDVALAPFSFPLNTLLSLSQYCLACVSLNQDPGRFRSCIKSVVGHSQGILAAAAVARAASWEAFYNATAWALTLSLHVGLMSHEAAPPSRISSAAAADCVELDEGQPSFMLGVGGLSTPQVCRLIEQVNRTRNEADKRIELALVNTADKVVVAGPPQSLRALCINLRQVVGRADQSRVVFHKRKPQGYARFLPVSAPFHSPHLAGVAERLAAQIALTPELGLRGEELGVPLLHPRTGENMQELGKCDAVSMLVRAVCVDMGDWPQVCNCIDATHVLSFGPGNIGRLVDECTAGTGLQIISMDDPHALAAGFAMTAESDSNNVDDADWEQLFAPCLVADGRGGHRLETKMTRLLGTPPILVAGMTPTTVKPDFCAAVINAGYPVELAGGGYHSSASFEAALRQLAAAIPPHRTIMCNLLYANPRIIGWQVSSIRRLIADGIPITGITIGAGIPSPDVIQTYIETLGLQHISFKPGSQAAIDQVIDIARGYPHFPIGLQWTGGRAGGHHSFEDFYAPIIASYSRIRSCANIVLIAGSGFGGSEDDSIACLTGEWARAHKRPPMPFDGILLGSRMMVASEAHTSLQAKQLILDAPGVDDSQWHHSFDRPTGGVITINSEMCQPIHVLATRGVMLWSDMDRHVFSIKDKEKRLAYLRTHREDIVSRLNKDYARPWFAVNDRGESVELEDLTYDQILQRLCELLFISHQARWIDPSYKDLVSAFVQLCQRRFCVQGTVVVQTPCQITSWFQQALGSHTREQIYPEDELLLMALFRRRGQKPMPFIPALDEHFETYFKKDSLWQSEDIDAVMDQDAQRVLVIQGPVAAQHSKSLCESAKDILDSISHDHVAVLKARYANLPRRVKSVVPSAPSSLPKTLPGLQIKFYDGARVYHIQRDVTSDTMRTQVMRHIAGAESWTRACLLNAFVYRRDQSHPNPIPQALELKAGHTIEVLLKDDASTGRITLCSSEQQGEVTLRSGLTLESPNGKDVMATVALPAFLRAKTPHVKLAFQVRDSDGFATLHEDDVGRKATFKDLYTHLWSDTAALATIKNASLTSELPGETLTLTRAAVQAFVDVSRQSDSLQLQNWNPSSSVPIDYCIVIAWKALTQPLLISALDCDLSKLLHRSIDFKYAPGASLLQVGDVVSTFSRITSISCQPNGKSVQVSAEICRSGVTVVAVTSEFFIQSKQEEDDKTQFLSCQESEMVVNVNTPVVEAVLRSRKWLRAVDHAGTWLGKSLIFALNTETIFDQTGRARTLQVTGVVHVESDSGTTRIGQVHFEQTGCTGNPVMEFLARHGSPRTKRHELESPGWNDPGPILVHAPRQSASYAKVSQDTNPIHVSPLFARLVAGLPNTVVHGMHTSALVRRIVEWNVGDGERSRFKGWHASFEGLVRPGDQLSVRIKHVAMQAGMMVLKVQAFNHATGDKVIEAEALLEQARTGYIFCGQGSQEKGMGMSLYATSEESKRLWSRGDRFLKDKYGISLLHIVQENPTSLTVHFGGQRGRRIRANYLAMVKNTRNGQECIVQGLTSTSTSHTFSYPKGLLFSTQFSQPALALMEMIEHGHLRAQALTQEGGLFAGHSLGEYAALMACTSIMSFERLLELIFYRGLKMQNALPRDATGHTEFSMMAVDPSRVSKAFEQTALENLVKVISSETDLELEVVNYNISSQQYVCAGHLRALWILGQVCDDLAASSSPQLFTLDELQTMVRCKTLPSLIIKPGSALSRGKATVPLSGIDIPFHSKMLRPEIDNYRQYLKSKLRRVDIKLNELVGRWIPNVVGTPFAVDKEFVQKVAAVTGSKNLEDMMLRMGNGVEVVAS